MDRERPSVSEEKIPEAWIGQEVVLETTEALSTDLRASAPVYLEDVNDRGVVTLVARHHDQSQSSRYFYPWSVVGWIRLAEDDERAEPRATLLLSELLYSSNRAGSGFSKVRSLALGSLVLLTHTAEQSARQMPFLKRYSSLPSAHNPRMPSVSASKSAKYPQ